jgi:hypothetical protein
MAHRNDRIAMGGVMLKFDFSIKTRDGQRIESIVIGGQDQADAERKLRQMYRHCEVLDCQIKSRNGKQDLATSVEEILSLISK